MKGRDWQTARCHKRVVLKKRPAFFTSGLCKLCGKAAEVPTAETLPNGSSSSRKLMSAEAAGTKRHKKICVCSAGSLAKYSTPSMEGSTTSAGQPTEREEQPVKESKTKDHQNKPQKTVLPFFSCVRSIFLSILHQIQRINCKRWVPSKSLQRKSSFHVATLADV